MAETTIEQLTPEEREAIRQRLSSYVTAMSDAELQIAARSEASFADFIATAAQAIAALLGYVIALPIAWVTTFVEALGEGFEKGIKAGWNQGRAKKFRDRANRA